MMAEQALQSFLKTYGTQSDVNLDCATNIPRACCCGNPGCAYLRQNQASLEDLEQDVRNAAKLGQVRVAYQSPSTV
jgi:hypothetical protein